MKSLDIAKHISFIRCIHKKLGMPGCLPCTKRYEKRIDDDLGIAPIIAAARFIESATRSLDRISSLTWCSAIEITKVILDASRKEKV